MLRFVDSFDHYATGNLAQKWTSLVNSPSIVAAGRRSTSCFRTTNSNQAARVTLPVSGTTGIIGVNWKPSTIARQRLVCAFESVAVATMALVINPDGTLSAYRGELAALLGTTSIAVVSENVDAYIEFKCVFSATVGTVDVRVNGVNVLALTGKNTGTAWNGIKLGDGNSTSGPTAHTFDYDDLYVCDGVAGADPANPCNDFLNDCRIDVRRPIGVGTTTQFTPSAGANWTNVDEVTPNDDTDYNSSATPGQLDTFEIQDVAVSGAGIIGVQTLVYAKKSDAGVCTVAEVIRSGGVNYVGTPDGVATTYDYTRAVYETNPTTGLAWTEVNFNSAEMGYKKVT